LYTYLYYNIHVCAYDIILLCGRRRAATTSRVYILLLYYTVRETATGGRQRQIEIKTAGGVYSSCGGAVYRTYYYNNGCFCLYGVYLCAWHCWFSVALARVRRTTIYIYIYIYYYMIWRRRMTGWWWWCSVCWAGGRRRSNRVPSRSFADVGRTLRRRRRGKREFRVTCGCGAQELLVGGGRPAAGRVI